MSSPQQISLAMAATPVFRQRRILTLRKLMSLLLVYNNATMRYEVRDLQTFQTLVMTRLPDPALPPDRLQWFYDWLAYGFERRWSIEQINDSMIRYRNTNNVLPTPPVVVPPAPWTSNMQVPQPVQNTMAPQFASNHLMLPPTRPSPPFGFNGMQHSLAASQSHQGLTDTTFTVSGIMVQAGVNASVPPIAPNNLSAHFVMPHHQVLRSNASLHISELDDGDAGSSTLHDSNRDQVQTVLSTVPEQQRAPNQPSTSANTTESTDQARITQAGSPSAIEHSLQFDESINWNDPAILDGFSGVFDDNMFEGAVGDPNTLDG